MWAHVTPHSNNVIDVAETKEPEEINYEDRRNQGEVPEIPLFWIGGTRQRHGEESKTFQLYGPLGLSAGAHFGSVQCRVYGQQEDDKDRASASSWGFGRSEAEMHQQSLSASIQEGDERGIGYNNNNGAMINAFAPSGSRIQACRTGQMDRADPLGLGIPGSLKIITYQTLTHTLKNVLSFNYSGVCCLTVI